MSVDGDKISTLESCVSIAEYAIGNYLKDHNGCGKEELMVHILKALNQKASHKSTIYTANSIHILAWLISFKELEQEGIIQVDRMDLPFPAIDNRSRFSLKQH